MADKFPTLTDEHTRFIERQQMFFTGTAARDGRVNVSPKGQDSLRITAPDEIVWLNLTGSGNETAAHVLDVNRITLMWCAFEGPPQILRVYGTAELIHPRDERWGEYSQLIEPRLGARQYVRVGIEMVQTSCGYAVPFLDYREDRVALDKWSENKGADGIERYWRDTNATSLDGLPTGILD